MNLWKNWVKLFTWLWQEHPPVLCCQKQFFAYSYILQRIWDRTLLNCLFHNGRLFEIKPIKPTATNYLLRSIYFLFRQKICISKAPVQLEKSDRIFGSCFSTNHRRDISFPLLGLFPYIRTWRISVYNYFVYRRHQRFEVCQWRFKIKNWYFYEIDQID